MKAQFGTWKWIEKKNNSGRDLSRLSFLIGYLYNETKLKRMLKVTGSTHDFTFMTPEVKTKFLYDLTKDHIKKIMPQHQTLVI